MRTFLILLALAASLGGAAAQEQPLTSEQQLFLQEALAVLQRQRDDAINAVVNAEARAALLIKQNRALAERVKALETKLTEEPRQ